MQVSGLCHLSPLGKSDHDIIVFNFHAYIDFAKPKDRYIYANGQYDDMRNELRSTNWSKEFVESGSEKGVEELWGLFKENNPEKTFFRKKRSPINERVLMEYRSDM